MSYQFVMEPATGESALRFVGDRLRFALRATNQPGLPEGWRAFLRTNLGRGAILRQEIFQAHLAGRKLANAPWRDVPMEPAQGEWSRELTLTEPGYFRAKAFAVDPQGRQHWPPGPDVGVRFTGNRCRMRQPSVSMTWGSWAIRSRSLPEGGITAKPWRSSPARSCSSTGSCVLARLRVEPNMRVNAQ